MAGSDQPGVGQEREALDRLDGMVRKVSVALRSLREENGHLKRMLEERAVGPDGAGDWEEEKSEIRRRLERLTAHLEELLGDG